MNAGGQLAGLNFPNFTGFSGQVLNQGPDRDVNLVMIKAYNDWHVDEWCGAYPGRFIPCGILPLFDVAEAAKEVKRLADKGCHAVTFSENPEALQHAQHPHQALVSAVRGRVREQDGAVHPRRLVVAVAACCRRTRRRVCTMTASSMMSMFTFTELIWAEFYTDFPELKFSLTEGDVGWIPYFLWRAEHVLQPALRVDATRNSPRATAAPPTCSSEHFYTCFISDKVGVKNMDWFNEDMLCWESDFPHSDSNWPFAPEDVIETMGHLDDAVINKITHENAMAAYSFDPFTHIPKEHARAGYLRAQATDVDVVTHVGHKASQRDRDAWTADDVRSDRPGTAEAAGIAERATALGQLPPGPGCPTDVQRAHARRLPACRCWNSRAGSRPSYCGKMFADAGAEVVKVEPAAGRSDAPLAGAARYAAPARCSATSRRARVR